MRVTFESLKLYFKVTAAIAILLAAMCKFVAVSAEKPVLGHSDQVVGFLSHRQLLLIAALTESAIAVIILTEAGRRYQVGLLAVFSSLLALYRFTFWAMDAKGECLCMGFIWDFLAVTPVEVDFAVRVLFYYLLIGSYGLLIWEWRQRGKLRVEGGGLSVESGAITDAR